MTLNMWPTAGNAILIIKCFTRLFSAYSFKNITVIWINTDEKLTIFKVI